MAPLPDLAARELTRRLHLRLDAIAGPLLDYVLAAWEALPDFDEIRVLELWDTIERAVAAADAQVIATSSVYTTTLAGVPPAGLPVDRVLVVPPDVREAFTATWNRFAKGEGFEEAFDAGRSALAAQVRLHVTRTSRQAVAVTADRARIRRVGWRRTLTGGSCEWCAVVSTQIYRTAETADFGHNRCDCGVAPVFLAPPPGEYLDPELAENLQASGAFERATDSRRARRAETAAEAAASRRDQLLASARREPNPDARIRLLEQARQADKDAVHHAAVAAQARTRPRAGAGEGTGYVDPAGVPAPRP